MHLVEFPLPPRPVEHTGLRLNPASWCSRKTDCREIQAVPMPVPARAYCTALLWRSISSPGLRIEMPLRPSTWRLGLRSASRHHPPPCQREQRLALASSSRWRRGGAPRGTETRLEETAAPTTIWNLLDRLALRWWCTLPRRQQIPRVGRGTVVVCHKRRTQESVLHGAHRKQANSRPKKICPRCLPHSLFIFLLFLRLQQTRQKTSSSQYFALFKRWCAFQITVVLL